VAEDALSVKLGVLDLGGILVVYGNKTTVVTERTEDAQRKKKTKIYGWSHMLALFYVEIMEVSKFNYFFSSL